MTARPIQVKTNSFAITRLPNKEYYMYDVFTPDVPQLPKRNRLFHHLQTNVAPDIFNPRLIYDNRAIAYSPGMINFGGGNSSATFQVSLEVRGPPPPGTRGVYHIRINLTRSPPINPRHVRDVTHGVDGRVQVSERSLTATNVMQLIVRQWGNQHHTNNGRAYFTSADRNVIRGSGLELWRGIFQSVRPTLGKMVLTVDTSTATVYKSGELIEVALDFLQSNNIRSLALQETDPQFKKLQTFLKKVRVKVQTGPNGAHSRIKTIRGLVANGGTYTFYKEDAGRDVTVAEHFWETYNIQIRNPRIIGIKLSGRKGHDDVVPAELCKIESGQLYRHKINELVTAQMVKFSTMRPMDRLHKIEAAANGNRMSEYIVESGMVVDTAPMTINAAVLATPQVRYGHNGKAEVRNGGWNVVKQRLFEPAELKIWAIVNFSQGKVTGETCQRMVSGLLASCHDLGMPARKPVGIYPALSNDVQQVFEKVMGEIQSCVPPGTRPREIYLFVILPDNAGPLRSEIKCWGDTKGIAIQCVREGKIFTANNQYWNNNVIKLNARLGGINSIGVSRTKSKLQQEPFIIMGADVGHPGPGSLRPSVTSLVYSHDRNAVQYRALVGIQDPRTEMIADLQKFVAKAVNDWGSTNNAAPRRIIFFRDGVSEGEFERVAEDEIKKIQAGIDEVWERNKVKAPKPLLTFIVVGKRHHAVFFPAEAMGADRTGNCHAGTVMDREITHPAYKNFYLQSHAAIQGTCRSSHYIVLQDDTGFSPQEIQELAFTLCHDYAKATRSVSIPAPVYYADRVCSRLAFHIPAAQLYSIDDGMSVASGQAPQFDLGSWQSAFRPVYAELARTMYFL